LNTLKNLPVRVGDRVRARHQRWRVDGVQPGEGCALLTLAGTGPGNHGARRRLVWPFDDVETRVAADTALRPRVVAPRVWRRACRALLTAEGPADALRTAVRARIDLMPYQLEPALALVRGLGSRVLIADEVGLGKTIQAGLIVAELMARGAAERALVVTPAGLREQWSGELSERFGLQPTIVDAQELRRRKASLPLGVNPWSTEPLVITSCDYAKRPDVAPALLACRWDIVVLDEAHGVAPGSERHDAMSALCSRAAYVVLLTATPHNGDRRAFAALCDLGKQGDELLVFRRTRADAAIEECRRVHRIHVLPTAAESRMHALLEQLTRLALSSAGSGDSDIRLALGIMHKRALSSAASLERSIRRRLEITPRMESGGAMQLPLPLDELSGEHDAADEAPTWTTPVLDDPETERRLLATLADAARQAASRESKLVVLERLLARCARLGESAIVFTEYRDTLAHVRAHLRMDCAVIHGGLNRRERSAALDAFSRARGSVLLATDAAGEGLNLQHAARVVINLELPWNPVRLEQRIGRVDRIGQRHTVHAFHLIGRDTGETRVLQRLRSRVHFAHMDIGMSDPIGSLIAAHADSPENEALTPLRLTEEAVLEHARLTLIRAVLNDDDPPQRPLIAFAKRRDTRLALGSQWLVVLRTSAQDEQGRAVASRLTPLRIAFATAPHARIDRGLVTAFAAAIPDAPLVKALTDSVRWAAEVRQVHGRFWSTRLARERAIADGSTGSFQHAEPGLFDRRVEHELTAAAAVRAEQGAEAARQIAAAHAAMHVVVDRTGLALVMVPR
jgi:superfamily II DNA or RNA helicase